MTNEEKIRELARLHQGTMTDSQYLQMLYALEEMAEWKDEQIAQEKRNIIDKTCEWLKNNAGCYMESLLQYGEGYEFHTEDLIEDYLKYMKGK